MADAWKQLAEKVKAKRLKKNSGTDVKARRLKGNELTVQRLSSSVSGKAQKYTRIGPREFVSLGPSEAEDLSIEIIKTACEKHFSNSVGDMACDVLAGEQGPSCRSVEQIPDLKVIHIRFVRRGEQDSFEPKRRRTMDDLLNSVEGSSTTIDVTRSEERQDERRTGHPSSYSFCPRSLSVTDMIKLGKISPITPNAICTYRFDMEDFSWSKVPTVVEFFEQEKAIGSGGFRKAFKATSKHPEFRHSEWAIKKYLENALKAIRETGMSVETHTRKVVQMHMLAKNFASKLTEKVSCNNLEKSFGPTLKYRKIFFGHTDTMECVTIEEFVPGNFVKYTNNTGLLCVDKDNEFGQKAECLSHYSFQKSEQKLLLVDIQGSGYDCFDPEIASAELFDSTDREVLYCTGNLSTMAITNFVNSHNCNKYCNLLGLGKLNSTQ